MSVRELKERLVAGESVYLIDVREQWEHELAKLDDQLWIPLGELMERADEVTPEARALVVVYCHHGVRSMSGAAILGRVGIEAVSLAGGIERWSVEVDGGVGRY